MTYNVFSGAINPTQSIIHPSLLTSFPTHPPYLPPFLPTYIHPSLPSVDSIRGFALAHAAGFAMALRCLRFLVP